MEYYEKGEEYANKPDVYKDYEKDPGIRSERENKIQETILNSITTQAPDLAKNVGTGKLGIAVTKIIGDAATGNGTNLYKLPWENREKVDAYVNQALSDILNNNQLYEALQRMGLDEFLSNLADLIPPFSPAQEQQYPGQSQQGQERGYVQQPPQYQPRQFAPRQQQQRAQPTYRKPFQYRPLMSRGQLRI